MPVNKFGSDGSNNEYYSKSNNISIDQIYSTFLRKDGNNTATGNLNMGNHKILNIVDPTNTQDAATKNYVDTLKVNKAGDTMTGSLFIATNGSNDIKDIGCTNVNSGGTFNTYLGSTNARFTYKDLGQLLFLILDGGLTINNRSKILFTIGVTPDPLYAATFNVPIVMYNNKILNLANPTSDQDAATKKYVDSNISSGLKTDGSNNMEANLNMENNNIINLSDPRSGTIGLQDAVTRNYVDYQAYQFADRFPPVDMTGLNTPTPFVVTTNNSTPSGWYAFAHSDAQDWLCSSATNSWVQIIGDFKFVLKRFVIRGSFNGSGGIITNWSLEGFNDNGANYVILANQSSFGGGNITLGTTRTILLPNNTIGFRGYRFNCISGTGTVSINYIGLYNGINNFDVYGDNKMLGNIDMNDRQIINLNNPSQLNDAATKNYVDTLLRKNYTGYIPILEANTSKLGFVVTVSSFAGASFQGYGAFNSLNVEGNNGSWVTNASTTGWIQIKCPESIRIWRIALKARAPNVNRNITGWNISASNDEVTFTTLLNSTTVLLGAATTPTFFNISTNSSYMYYRLNITASVGSGDVGVQVFQLYTML